MVNGDHQKLQKVIDFNWVYSKQLQLLLPNKECNHVRVIYIGKRQRRAFKCNVFSARKRKSLSTVRFKPATLVMESHFGQKQPSFFSGGRDFYRAVKIFFGRTRFFREVKIFLGRSRFSWAIEIFSGDRGFFRAVEIFFGRSRFFSSGRDFSRAIEIFLGQSRFFSGDQDFNFFSEVWDFSRTV